MRHQTRSDITQYLKIVRAWRFTCSALLSWDCDKYGRVFCVSRFKFNFLAVTVWHA